MGFYLEVRDFSITMRWEAVDEFREEDIRWGRMQGCVQEVSRRRGLIGIPRLGLVVEEGPRRVTSVHARGQSFAFVELSLAASLEMMRRLTYQSLFHLPCPSRNHHSIHHSPRRHLTTSHQKHHHRTNTMKSERSLVITGYLYFRPSALSYPQPANHLPHTLPNQLILQHGIKLVREEHIPLLVRMLPLPRHALHIKPREHVHQHDRTPLRVGPLHPPLHRSVVLDDAVLDELAKQLRVDGDELRRDERDARVLRAHLPEEGVVRGNDLVGGDVCDGVVGAHVHEDDVRVGGLDPGRELVLGRVVGDARARVAFVVGVEGHGFPREGAACRGGGVGADEVDVCDARVLELLPEVGAPAGLVWRVSMVGYRVEGACVVGGVGGKFTGRMRRWLLSGSRDRTVMFGLLGGGRYRSKMPILELVV